MTVLSTNIIISAKHSSYLNSTSYHEDWIDILKGLGILSVVIGHLYPECRWVFIYHMPLFFVLAGYTLNLRTPFRNFVHKKSKRMLLPYLSFFVLLAAMQCSLNLRQLLSFVYGGQKLCGVYSVFWFITVLYMAEVGMRCAIRRFRLDIIFVASLVLGYSLSGTKNWPWNLNVVPMAMAYMCVGLFLKKHSDIMDKIPSCVKWLLLLSMTLVPIMPNELLLDMKYANFGFPVLSFIISVVVVVILMLFSKELFDKMILGGDNKHTWHLLNGNYVSTSVYTFPLFRGIAILCSSCCVHSTACCVSLYCDKEQNSFIIIYR